jgi:competence protein ComGC
MEGYKVKALDEKGFSLVEMLIVLMIMTSLLLIAVPSLKKHNSIVNEKGCEATKSLVIAQSESYAIANDGKLPTKISDLKGYISNIGDDETLTCPGGEKLQLEINENNGEVVVQVETDTTVSEQ